MRCCSRSSFGTHAQFSFSFALESKRAGRFFSITLLVFIEFDSRRFHVYLDCVEYRSQRCIQCMPYPYHRHSPFNAQLHVMCACIVRVHFLLYYLYIFSAKRIAYTLTLSGCILWLVCARCNHLVSWFDRSSYTAIVGRETTSGAGIWPLLK